MAEEKVDLMVFGASGYTGQYVVEILAKTAKDEGMTWAVAGRYKDKIEKVLAFTSSETGINVDDVKIYTADSNDYESLLEICKNSRIVLNCVGPYRWYGEPVVKACLETGTHHVDVCGEPNFLEKIQLLYHDVAKEKGIYVVGACGFDSIPCEMGTVLLQEKFGSSSELNSVEEIIAAGSKNKDDKPAANYGTWDSAVNSLSLRDDLVETRRGLKEKFYTKPYPKPKYKLESRGILSKNSDNDKWLVILPAADAPVFYRTQQDRYQIDNERPSQFKSYLEVDSLVSALFICLMGMIMYVMSQFSLTRTLLHKYPEFFSFGVFRKSGPTREQVMNGDFCITLIGEGWEEKQCEPTDNHDHKPNKKLTVQIKGPHAYNATSICMIQSAIVILKQGDKLPASGGVYTPGTAFKNTSLIERLSKNGITMKAL